MIRNRLLFVLVLLVAAFSGHAQQGYIVKRDSTRVPFTRLLATDIHYFMNNAWGVLSFDNDLSNFREIHFLSTGNDYRCRTEGGKDIGEDSGNYSKLKLVGKDGKSFVIEKVCITGLGTDVDRNLDIERKNALTGMSERSAVSSYQVARIVFE